ncbi:hypothetical protein EMIHUDRAFT_444149 [Emiliania huxleyi CCMP1516]|uniref:Uncharacterized protein n=4 Tax=Emiliania huxleyi TaxID=2903 RepID=A0A0D3JIP2_EMIH1|nr:hypothetical protein EMIHUDRAFT_444149 [Emiliania huxleyi CCMP1516]EOD23377.1 hypothetical protein EMIHUDRAFT_444149 [Emiliania huxleyi CCMP1516]|mmetsp:Transcript_49230/g.163005  ORF Transcript_49230/g.163005 Transcript_49230/m.163005 type:complete len:129 (+) Transcript_49230:107-493(+)|eukprot:XP_005775806.1 hypothetical protein EMIHUDRAFT_444149 [Emiliania huxleyi CCMP1516]
MSDVALHPGDRCRLQDLTLPSCSRLNGASVMVLGHVDCASEGGAGALWVVRWEGSEELFRVARRHLCRLHHDTSIAPRAVPEWRQMPPPPEERAFTWGAPPGKLEGVPASQVLFGQYANELQRSNPIW